MVPYGFAHRAEDDALLLQRFLIGGGHRHAVHYRVHRDTGQALPFLKGDSQLFEGRQYFRINFIHALGPVSLWGRVVIDVLIVDGRIFHVGPSWRLLLQLQPMAERLEPPFQKPLRLFLLRGDQPDDVLIQPLGG